MAEIKVMSAGAVKSMVAALGAEFESETGNKLNLNFGTAGSLRERIKDGETADLVVLVRNLQSPNWQNSASWMCRQRRRRRSYRDWRGGTRRRAGAGHLDAGSIQAGFSQCALRRLHRSEGGGSGGIMFSALLETLGIAEEINKKAVLGKSGHDVTISIAEGRAEIGTTFISEVLPVKGARVVGPLPGELHIANTYTAAIHAQASVRRDAEALLRKLTDTGNAPALDCGRSGAGFSGSLTPCTGRGLA